jgi:alcohol dehydrogenase class IV
VVTISSSYVLAFNRKAIEDKLIRMARYISLKEASFAGVMQWVLDLREQIGIPHTLKDLGMTEKHIGQLSDMAAVDPCAGGNPVKAGVPETKVMYEAALAGRL